MNPHRNAPEKCEACAAREEALEEMEPFKNLKDCTCPACNTLGVQMWQILCHGDGQVFITGKKGIWPFKKNVVEHCDENGASHFHMQCPNCKYSWLMLSKLETK